MNNIKSSVTTIISPNVGGTETEHRIDSWRSIFGGKKKIDENNATILEETDSQWQGIKVRLANSIGVLYAEYKPMTNDFTIEMRSK